MAKDTGVLCLQKVHKDVLILVVFVNGSYLCIYLNVYVPCGWVGAQSTGDQSTTLWSWSSLSTLRRVLRIRSR